MSDKNCTYSAEYLKQLIKEHEIISFDLFDTLVMRNVYYNKDVFKIVGENLMPNAADDFYQARVEAERELTTKGYPYIEEIYESVAKKLKISDKLTNDLMNYEMDTEAAVIIPKFDMIEIFDYAKILGKKVYIVSDMYIRLGDLEKIIKNLSIKGYEKMFVSCEYDSSKPQRLFEKFLKEVKSNSYLHVGDSFECDVAPAEKLGIHSFRVKSSAELYENEGGIVPKNLVERTDVAKYISHKFNSPFFKEE